MIAVYNIKGGVGKTATAVNLAHLSAAHGARTLVWDLDPQGAATFYFRVRHEIDGSLKKLLRGKQPIESFIRETDFEGLDLLPSDFSYRNLDLALEAAGKPKRRLARLVQPLAKRYDHLYIDCSPSISLVSEGVFHAADALLVPTIPTSLSLRTLQQLAGHLQGEKLNGLRVLPFFCMVDRRKAMHREIVDAAPNGSWSFLRSQIPYASAVEQMGKHRAPVVEFAPNAPAAEAYRALWKETMESTQSLLGWFRPRGRSRFPF